MLVKVEHRMPHLLQIFSLGMSAYGIYAMFTGSVWAKHGAIGMAKVERSEQPLQFWGISVIYVVMGQFMYWAMRYHLSH